MRKSTKLQACPHTAPNGTSAEQLPRKEVAKMHSFLTCVRIRAFEREKKKKENHILEGVVALVQYQVLLLLLLI